MDSPNRNANTISGIQNVTAPVAWMPKIAFEPCPSCQNSTITPSVAASESRLSSTALNGSSSERNARTSSTKVSSAMIVSISGKLP